MPVSKKQYKHLVALLRKARAIKKKKQQRVTLSSRNLEYVQRERKGPSKVRGYKTYGNNYTTIGLSKKRKKIITLRPKRKIKRFDDVFGNLRRMF